MGWVSRAVLLTGLLSGLAQALYVNQQVIAIQVPRGKIVVDGKLEQEWREIGVFARNNIELKFNDYSHIVLVGRDSILNDPPENHFTAPSSGAVSMMAAYDADAMYFFFIVKENNSFTPSSSNCLATDLWKTHSVEVFVDPNPFDQALYTTTFSADAGQVSYGTSPKSYQFSKPTWPAETRNYFRDRTVGNRFAIRTGTGVRAASTTRTANDKLTYGVEMKVPHPNAADFFAGKTMYISWGYNHYPEAPRTNCDENPIGFRWARHEKNYADSTLKPPGWKPGDLVHFDPLRSYDGWGKLLLDPWLATGKSCNSSALVDTVWDPSAWQSCFSIPTTVGQSRLQARAGSSLPALLGMEGARRDIRGRLVPESAGSLRLLALPLREAEAPVLR
jgi:hypothetical protein